MPKASSDSTPEALAPQAAQDPIVRWYLGIEWDGLSGEECDVAVMRIHRETEVLAATAGGLVLAADKLRLLVALMRENETHVSEFLAERNEYLLAESALRDLTTAIQ